MIKEGEAHGAGRKAQGEKRIVLMEDPEDIRRYWKICKKIPWIDEDGPRVAVGRVLCGDYGCLKLMTGDRVNALIIFQNQLGTDDNGMQVANCFIVQVIPLDNVGIVKEFDELFMNVLKEWKIYKIQTTSARNLDAIEKLFGLEYRYSFYERRVS